MAFKLNDKVAWTSTSLGCTKSKVGTIRHVIAPGARLTEEQAGLLGAPGGPRDHESYIVHVPSKTGRGKGQYYWPRVSGLSSAKN